MTLHYSLLCMYYARDVFLQNFPKLEANIWEFNVRENVTCIYPFVSSDTIVCGWRFETATDIIVHVVHRKHFFNAFQVIPKNDRKLLKKCFLITGNV